MSTNNLRMLLSRIPKCSLRGVAYLAAANFLARVLIFVRNYIVTYFHSEMVLIYGASLDTRILLFFQAIYMLPMFLLGILVFYGIERQSFNLVLYPTLMLLFLVLIRYGSEAALLVSHWEDHKFDQTPDLVFTFFQDIAFIALLFVYVYFCLAFTPIKPTPLELLEGGNAALASAVQGTNLVPVAASNAQQQQQQQVPSTSQQQLPLPQNHTDPDSQGFNYGLRRNVGQIPKDSTDKAMLEDIERQRQRNSLVLKESKGVIETDLDAVAVLAAEVKQSEVAPESQEPAVTVKPPKLRKSAAKKQAAAIEEKSAVPPVVEEEQEKVAEPEPDFWASMNGDSDPATTTADGFKTTSV